MAGRRVWSGVLIRENHSNDESPHSVLPAVSEYGKSPESEKSAVDVTAPVYDIRSEENRLRRKLDHRIMPLPHFPEFTYHCLDAFCFLDRVNVGFASVAGLQACIFCQSMGGKPKIPLNRSLGLHGIQYNIGNLLGKHFGMRRWLAGCGFGICCMCSAFVRNFAEFCFVRALLGVFEGGVLPGIASAFPSPRLVKPNIYYPPQWVSSSLQATSAQHLAVLLHPTSREQHWLAENLAQLLAHFQIFLIEGLITTVVAICVFFLVIDSPLQARWLTEEEKILAVGRLESEYPAINEAAQHTRKQTIRQGLLNINASTWLIAIGFLFITAVFFPTVIATLFPEKTPVAKQLLSVPPYLMDAVMQIITPYVSMRMDTRGPFMAALAGVGIIGYAIFVGSKSLHARYAACFLVAAGAFPFGAFSPGLVAVNTGPDTTRAVALGILSSIGYLGGIISTWTYVNADAPDYRNGNTLNLAGMVIVLVLTVVTMIYMKWENAQRARGARDHHLDGLTPAEEAQLGHLHPKFRYKL
ncbi:major facilitator superfamily domain-containing protein [Mycena vulgaris]|nr:major facilitator superfamily domain-containing protein [Mycena vulgaris]